MALTFTQTDSTTDTCTNCSATALAARRAAAGETVGSTPQSVTVPASGVAFVTFTCIVASGVTWDAGTWTVPFNVTTGNMNLDLDINSTIYRVNSSCTNQAEMDAGANWDASDMGSAGVFTATFSTGAQTPSVGDKVRICIRVLNSAMTDQSFEFTPDQNIASPFSEPVPDPVARIMNFPSTLDGLSAGGAFFGNVVQ